MRIIFYILGSIFVLVTRQKLASTLKDLLLSSTSKTTFWAYVNVGWTSDFPKRKSMVYANAE